MATNAEDTLQQIRDILAKPGLSEMVRLYMIADLALDEVAAPRPEIEVSAQVLMQSEQQAAAYAEV